MNQDINQLSDLIRTEREKLIAKIKTEIKPFLFASGMRNTDSEGGNHTVKIAFPDCNRNCNTDDLTYKKYNPLNDNDEFCGFTDSGILEEPMVIIEYNDMSIEALLGLASKLNWITES